MTDPYAPSPTAGEKRSWLVPLIIGLAALAAFGGFAWGHADATALGLDEEGVQTAAMVVAGAAAVGTFGLGNLVATLLGREPGKERAVAVGIGLSVLLLVVAAVLFLVVHPMVVDL
ncbi:hypothetical protein ACPYO6_11895 [Georgenia sp. Z1344]|uniref:hypothetical protein n=1 Tax=Georgenia sp. Z1344 TaxID=3416706 RepID=UPI003CFB2565